MTARPSYLKVLNFISNAEWHAHLEFDAWARVTRDEAVRRVVRLVAAREGEHALSFEKRIFDLGFSVMRKDIEGHADKLRLLSDPKISDFQKLDMLGYGDHDANAEHDDYEGFFLDHSIDIESSALLGRYIGEERDTRRRLQACYQELKTQPQPVAA